MRCNYRVQGERVHGTMIFVVSPPTCADMSPCADATTAWEEGHRTPT